MKKAFFVAVLLGATALTLDACTSNQNTLEATANSGSNLQSPAAGRELAFAANKLLARSINYSGMEFPVEGDWTPKLEESSFEAIKQAGFSAIRLPVKFSGHALNVAPYTLEPQFMARVDWAIDNATKRRLAIVVDLHHYDELMMEPVAERARFLAIWDQIAARYKDRPASVIFEIGNEPHGKLDIYWNEYQNAAVEVIRRTNPTRALIVGTKDWNNAVHLPHMAFANDPNLIVTFHHYGPHSFTHQGAHWEVPVQPTGVTWPGANLEWRQGWQAYPSNAVVALEASGIGLSFQGIWSGLTLHHPYPASGVYALRLKTDRAAELVVSCHTPNNDQGFEVISPKYFRVNTQAGVVQDVSISSCGNGNAFTDLSIQSPLEGAQPKITVQTLELLDSGGAHPLALNAQEYIRAALDLASDWGKVNNRPMFMGEFGTYIKTDQTSRERYTRFNREEAERREISWAYFDFSTYFRVYELDTKTWQTGLLKALIPSAPQTTPPAPPAPQPPAPPPPTSSVQVNVTVNWDAPTTAEGKTATARQYGLNLYKIFEPTEAVKDAYIAGVKAMRPGIVRVHRADQMSDSATTNAGWVLEPDKASYRWDKARIGAALSRVGEIGGERMMNIANFPAYLRKPGTQMQLRADKYNEYAAFCAELVRIVNVELKLNFKYWEVTNELDDGPTDGSGKYNAQFGEVGKIVKLAATAMKAVDPTVKVGGPALAQPNADRQRDEIAFLEQAGDAIDFFSFHSYVTDNKAHPLSSVWNSATDGVETINRVTINLVKRSTARPIEVFHDEYNISYGPPDPRMNNEVGAVFDALAMRALVLSGSSGGMAWNEADGWYGKLDGQYARRPSSFVYELFNTHLTGDVRASTSSDDAQVTVLAVQNGAKRAFALINRAVDGSDSNVAVERVVAVSGLSAGNWTRYAVGAAGLSTQTVSSAALSAGITLEGASVTVLVAAP